MKNNTNLLLLTCTILIVAVFFSLDTIHNRYLTSRIKEQFSNISGAYESFKCGCNSNSDINSDIINNVKGIEGFISDEESVYYKQYLYKLLSANNNDQIVKLSLKNSLKDIDLEVVFNNVLDHDKINDTDNNHAVIKDKTVDESATDYFIEKEDCTYTDSITSDNNEYKWQVTEISDDLKQFTLKFIKLEDLTTTITLVFKLKSSLQELYSNNISIKQLFAPTILEGITILKGGNDVEITSYSVAMIQFSEFTISRLSEFHNNIENIVEEKILDKPYDNLRKFGRIEKDINKLENYYKFKKNMEKNYITYKTLD